jgi:hypothetical protein
MNEVTELLAVNAERRITLAQELRTNQIGILSYEFSMLVLADRELHEIAELLGKITN